jgi:hypothetical protein
MEKALQLLLYSYQSKNQKTPAFGKKAGVSQKII